MRKKKKMYRAIHRTANAGFDIWFVCAQNEIEARKIIIENLAVAFSWLQS